MKVNLPFGKHFQNFSVSDKNIVTFIYPHEVIIKDENKSIFQALHNPQGERPFSQFIASAKKILIIVNDGTRPTPTEKVLDLLYNTIKDKDIFFLIATGTHRKCTKKELKTIFGKYYTQFIEKIFIHDAVEDTMIKAGVTELGTEVWYNKIIYDYEYIITISSVEPHYFAGFTGGRKSFLPGVSSFKTTEMNHKLALDSNAEVLKLKGNPVHEDMDHALQFLNKHKIFSIQTVLNKEDKIYFTAAGDIRESFAKAAKKTLDVYSVSIKKKADIVIAAVTPPMDINLYQSHKAMQHAVLALKPNGIIILVSSCKEGMGNNIFARLLQSSPTKDQLLEYAEKNFILGTQTAVKFTELSKQARLWAVTDIEPEVIRSIFMKPFNTLQSAVNQAVKQEPDGKVLVLMNATLTVPVLTS